MGRDGRRWYIPGISIRTYICVCQAGVAISTYVQVDVCDLCYIAISKRVYVAVHILQLVGQFYAICQDVKHRTFSLQYVSNVHMLCYTV